MKLTQEIIDQITAEVNEAISTSDIQPKSLNSDDILKNEKSIISFLEILVGLLPGIIGKLAGQGLIAAARAWFNAHRKQPS